MERLPEKYLEDLLIAIDEEKHECGAISADGAVILVKVKEYSDRFQCIGHRMVWSGEPSPLIGLSDALTDGYVALGLLVRTHLKQATKYVTTLISGRNEDWAEDFLRQITLELQRVSEEEPEPWDGTPAETAEAQIRRLIESASERE